MTITKPHTLNRPMHELRQLRENPELVKKLSEEERDRIALYAIIREEMDRDGLKPGHPYSAGDKLVIVDAPAA